MLYSAEQIAESLGVSKVTVYRKLKLQEVSCYITVNNGKQYVSHEGLEKIKSLINIQQDKQDQEVQHEEEKEQRKENIQEDSSFNNDYIEHLKAENERLWAEIEKKDKQVEALINDLSKMVEDSHRLVENSQVLLREHNDRSEDTTVQEAAVTDITEPVKREGFFKKIFKK